MQTYFANCLSQVKKKLTQVPILLHDNAPAHRSHVGQAAVLECAFEEMRHPPYVLTWHPVITTSFQKKNLCRQKFSTDEELKYAMEEW